MRDLLMMTPGLAALAAGSAEAAAPEAFHAGMVAPVVAGVVSLPARNIGLSPSLRL